jgi:hypothetical protein
MTSRTVIISHAIVVHDVPEYATKVTMSGEGECTCGWQSGHYAHGDDLSSALDEHDREHVAFTGVLVQEMLHQVIRDRTSLDSIQSTVHEVRESTEFEVHTTNTNDINDPPHLPAYTNEEGTILVTLVNNEQGALLARREHTSDRWPPGLHLTITRD